MREFILDAADFNLKKTIDSKPFYFFYDDKLEREVYFQGKKINLTFSQGGGKIRCIADREVGKKLKRRIEYCFGLHENYKDFYKICRKDKVIGKLIINIEGTRILSAFSDFEAVVGCVVSQNNSFRNYIRTMKRLGEFGFSPKKFLENDLSGFKLGYKVPYVRNVAKLFLEEENPTPEEILAVKGIGIYSLNLFRIFQLRDYTCFYWDCLTERIMREYYGLELGEKEGIQKAEEMWGKYRGLVEVYLQKLLNDTVE